MLTLKLVEITDVVPTLLAIETTETETGRLRDLSDFCGEPISVTHTWKRLDELGEMDENDSENWYRLIDTAIYWVYKHRGKLAGWRTYWGAYARILPLREAVWHYREFIKD